MSVIDPKPEPALSGALSVANQRRLYVHDPLATHDPGYTSQSVSAQRCLPERALWLAGPEDMVLLSAPIDSAYLQYMRSLGVGPQATLCIGSAAGTGIIETLLAASQWPPELVKWAEDQSTPIRMDPFCVTRESVQLNDALSKRFGHLLAAGGDPSATLRMNHKSFVSDQLEALGIPKIPGAVVDNTIGAGRRALSQIHSIVLELADAHEKVVVRADYSSVGAGNVLFDSDEAHGLDEWLLQHCASSHFLVEAYMPWKSSPNVQYWLSPEGDVELFQVTDQRINGVTSYNGNEYPAVLGSDPEVLRQGGILARWAASTGVRGFIGIDFIDTDEKGIRFVEINARCNGSTYATGLTMRVNQQRMALGLTPLKVWKGQRSVRSGYTSVTDLFTAATDLLYDHGKEAGVVPCSVSSLSDGICGCVTIAGNADQAQQLESEFIQRIKDL